MFLRFIPVVRLGLFKMLIEWIPTLLFLVVALGCAFWCGSTIIRDKLRRPPKGWLECALLSKQDNVPFPAKVRSPVVRRQFALAAKKPALFTNALDMHPQTVNLKKLTEKHTRRIYGFFHPHAIAGGGGERVLWAGVKQTLADKNNIVAIYTANKRGVTPRSVIGKMHDQFGFTLSQEEVDRIVFIYLTQTRYIEPSTYPFLTLLGQALGMMVVGYEAISNLMPDVFIDTTGFPFSYPVVSWLGCIPIVAYTHYPFVQTEMLNTLRLFSPKYIYWRFMLFAYKWSGSFASVVMANGTWTQNHLSKIWNRPIDIVYPPCGTQDFAAPIPREERTPALVYVAQFRPEKRHDLVIRAFAKIVLPARRKLHEPVHLIMIGSVRNAEDQARVAQLKELAATLKLTDDDVTIVENAPWYSVRQILSKSLITLNAMWNEHFGMGVVESMAAGLIPVVHASAGPLLDIVRDEQGVPGFFFQSKYDPDSARAKRKYPKLSEAMLDALMLPLNEQKELSRRCFTAAQRFSDAKFFEAWQTEINKVDKTEEDCRLRRKKLKLYD